MIQGASHGAIQQIILFGRQAKSAMRWHHRDEEKVAKVLPSREAEGARRYFPGEGAVVNITGEEFPENEGNGDVFLLNDPSLGIQSPSENGNGT